ncbi:MAG: nitroreductase family protein, partial [Dehalococcoidia bacterium]|nr:nitroreductase family protein [Dehalococcoidia bacterium]
MEIDSFLGLVRKRRSIRRFKPDPLPEGSVEKILEAARWAMSGANGQPWEFVVVSDADTREKIIQAYTEGRRHIKIIEQTRVQELRHPYFDCPETEPSLKYAPVFIVVCADPRALQATVLSSHFYGGEGGPMATFYKNMANATQLICFAAAALGLGTQWVSVNATWEAQVKSLLKIPQVIAVHTIVPVGYPDYKIPPPYRRKLDEIVHYGEYDSSKARTDEQIQDFLYNLRR